MMWSWLWTVLLQQVPIPTTGNNTTGTTNATTLPIDPRPDQVGPIGEFLKGIGVPYPEILGAIVTFIITSVVLYALGRSFLIPLLGRVLDRRGVEQHAKKPLIRLTKLGFGFLAVAFGFGFAGYGNILTSLATVSAAATLAIGFALQDVLKNFVAGVFIYTDHPFRIGDWIEWEGGNYSGIVEDISLRVSRIRTFDNELLTVPNSVLTQGVIKNPTAHDTLRIQITFGIGYDDAIDEATRIIREEAENHPDILSDPEPMVRMSTDSALADSYVGLTSQIWIEDPSREDFLDIRGDYITSVKTRFDDDGIDIPFPQIELSGGVALDETGRLTPRTNSD
jgi:small conductance mechanosensitive channel